MEWIALYVIVIVSAACICDSLKSNRDALKALHLAIIDGINAQAPATNSIDKTMLEFKDDLADFQKDVNKRCWELEEQLKKIEGVLQVSEMYGKEMCEGIHNIDRRG